MLSLTPPRHTSTLRIRDGWCRCKADVANRGAKFLQTVRKLQGLGIEWRKGAGVKEFRQLSPPWPSEAT